MTDLDFLLTDDVDGAVDDDRGRPPAGKNHWRRRGPHLTLAVVSSHAVHGSRPGRAVGVCLFAADEEKPWAVRGKRRARAPVLNGAKLVPLPRPEIVVLHGKILQQNKESLVCVPANSSYI